MAFMPLAQTFFFDSFEMDGGEIRFYYSTDAGHRFVHVLTHQFPAGASASALAPALFALGMAELAGYWKAILAPKIVIRAGSLAPEQVVFWQNLYTKGLGEFFYLNQIDFRNLFSIASEPSAPVFAASATQGTGALVPFGGGKDSLVTGEMLQTQGKHFTWFELEPLAFSEKLKALSPTTESVQVGRNVQKNFAPVIELVKAGAPNGHVPITSVYLFAAVLAAKAHGFSDVVLSLERSSEFGNVEYLGEMINHQYSKTFEFERAAQAYIIEHVDTGIRVFSLPRALYEIQIVERFTHYPQYFDAFVSCNRGLKTGTWCGECAKCAFMYAALSAFLPPARLETIFTKNLFEDEKLVPLYRDLIGAGDMKPFDCVGTFEENLLALYLSGEQYIKAGLPIPSVLRALPIAEGKAFELLLVERGRDAVPHDYAYE